MFVGRYVYYAIRAWICTPTHMHINTCTKTAWNFPCAWLYVGMYAYDLIMPGITKQTSRHKHIHLQINPHILSSFMLSGSKLKLTCVHSFTRAHTSPDIPTCLRHLAAVLCPQTLNWSSLRASFLPQSRLKPLATIPKAYSKRKEEAYQVLKECLCLCVYVYKTPSHHHEGLLQKKRESVPRPGRVYVCMCVCMHALV